METWWREGKAEKHIKGEDRKKDKGERVAIIIAFIINELPTFAKNFPMVSFHKVQKLKKVYI